MRLGCNEVETGRIALMVTEAATNLVKHAGRGEVLLDADTSDGHWRLGMTAIDRGPGISKADRLRIFDKFYRGAAASRDRKGFGLGLPIVQELVQAHRGRVEVCSTIGHGSTFSVILPATLQSRSETTRGGSPGTADITEVTA